MTDYTIASSVNIEKGKQNEEYCVEQVISFQQQTNMEMVFDEVIYPEESTLKKMDHVAVTVSLTKLATKRFNQITKSLSKWRRTEIWSPIEICNLYLS